MAEESLPTCSNPGCDQPGTKQCSACKSTPYCDPICQTAHWTHHKEECPGHLRKVGMAHLAKALGFQQQRNWVQTLRYADLALTKLKQLKDRRLETVEIIDGAFQFKFNALNTMGRDKEALECAKEQYTLWAMNHIRNPKMFNAVFGLIDSCIHNGEYDDALLYAHTAHEMVVNDADGIIPSDQRERLIAEGCYWLSVATHELAQAGGIPPEEKQKAGEKAIAAARQALEIRTRMHGIENMEVAQAITVLADVLDLFNDIDDDEVLRLHEQANSIISRLEGSSSVNVAVGQQKMGAAYHNRARRAQATKHLDQCITNFELSLSHFGEAIRIYRVNNFMDKANEVLRFTMGIEVHIQEIGAAARRS